MHKLFYSPEALNDLNEIWEYINDELHNPAAAKNTVEGIMNAVKKLREFPDMGSLLSVILEYESDYRYLVCGNYITF